MNKCEDKMAKTVKKYIQYVTIRYMAICVIIFNVPKDINSAILGWVYSILKLQLLCRNSALV